MGSAWNSLRLSAGVLSLAVAVSATPAVDNDDCLICHADPGLTMQLEDGTEMSLHVDPEHWAGSVHNEELVCTDCHQGYETDHPSGATFPGRRAYVIGKYETCRTCHFDTYTRTLESVHYELLRAGLEMAPVCTDCHGAHDTPDPHEKAAMVARSCSQCHERVYRVYAGSVHGAALVGEGNADVPGCADCHTHHTIEHPTTAKFRVGSPQICIDCHGDASLMERYDISTDVAKTYLADFHGVTAALLRDDDDVKRRELVVTCVDCHGAHSTVSPKAVGEEAMKATVAETCAGCHEGAAPDFPAAWLSHYEPSLRHAPLVYLVKLFYWVFIPFVVAGLTLQVLLHLYRAAAGR